MQDPFTPPQIEINVRLQKSPFFSSTIQETLGSHLNNVLNMPKIPFKPPGGHEKKAHERPSAPFSFFHPCNKALCRVYNRWLTSWLPFSSIESSKGKVTWRADQSHLKRAPRKEFVRSLSNLLNKLSSISWRTIKWSTRALRSHKYSSQQWSWAKSADKWALRPRA